MWSNNTNGDSLTWDFTIEILRTATATVCPTNSPAITIRATPIPRSVEDLDDDADGVPDTDEGDTGTSPTNPDTDGDGMCDGPVAIFDVCAAGPDAFPLDPSATPTRTATASPIPSTAIPRAFHRWWRTRTTTATVWTT